MRGNPVIFDNKIYIINKKGEKRRFFGFIPDINFRFKGHNSSIVFHEPIPQFSNCRFKLKDNSYIEILSSNQNIKIKKLHIKMESHQICHIGNNFSSNSTDLIFGSEPNLEIIIGNDCMFANFISIQASDRHTIIDLNTNQIENYGKNIIIGDNVWLAEKVSILKGAQIPKGSVIGRGSIVTKPLDKEYAIMQEYPQN